MLPAQGKLVFVADIQLALDQQLGRVRGDRRVADLVGLDGVHRPRAELLDGRLINAAHDISVVLMIPIEDLQRHLVVAVGLALDLELNRWRPFLCEKIVIGQVHHRGDIRVPGDTVAGDNLVTKGDDLHFPRRPDHLTVGQLQPTGNGVAGLRLLIEYRTEQQVLC
ncbi:hypothetical protein D9M69_473050 [compost metagenome]